MQISEHLTHMKIHPNDTIPISWLMPDGASSWPEETRKPDLERLKKEPLTYNPSNSINVMGLS